MTWVNGKWVDDYLDKIYDNEWDNVDTYIYYIITNDNGGDDYTATKIDDVYARDFENDIILVERTNEYSKTFYKVTNRGWEEPYPVRGVRHRDNGPAQIEGDGTESWFRDGELHRANGPCVDYSKCEISDEYPEDRVDMYAISSVYDTDDLCRKMFEWQYRNEIIAYNEARKKFNLRNGWDETGIYWLGHTK